jgi:hypothetical protein
MVMAGSEGEQTAYLMAWKQKKRKRISFQVPFKGILSMT